jgi:peptidoglycan/xylan/chitin deacetylase (PgdA/CDA1 family)
MKAIGLMYHDVVPPGEEDASGFPGAGPARYKLQPDRFALHLEAIAAAGRAATTTSEELAASAQPPLFLTFDDGGSSALAIADLLAEHGWKGHFFITTDRIDTPGFLSTQDLPRLRDGGHVIGSHSCSHPERMSRCSREELDREWTLSVARLAEILGAGVTCASVPGGYYATAVAQAAAASGITTLFTSEPTTRIRTVDGCRVVGRFAVLRGTPTGTVAALAAGRLPPRARQFASWNTKKVAKTVGGDTYVRFRRAVLARLS